MHIAKAEAQDDATMQDVVAPATMDVAEHAKRDGDVTMFVKENGCTEDPTKQREQAEKTAATVVAAAAAEEQVDAGTQATGMTTPTTEMTDTITADTETTTTSTAVPYAVQKDSANAKMTLLNGKGV